MNQKLLTQLDREEMKRRDWTVATLALEADVAFETARRVYRGIGVPSIKTGEKILAALGHRARILPHQSDLQDEQAA